MKRIELSLNSPAPSPSFDTSSPGDVSGRTPAPPGSSPLSVSPDATPLRAAACRAMHGAISFFLGQEREVHQEIAALSGPEQGKQQFQELLAKVDSLPERSQPKAQVSMMMKVGEMPAEDRLECFRSVAIQSADMEPEFKNAMKQAMEIQVGMVPPLESFSAFKIMAMYCAGQVAKSPDWKEPTTLTTRLDECQPEQQLPAAHATLGTVSQWLPEHRKVIVGALAESVSNMQDNQMNALRTILNDAATLPKRDYVSLLRMVFHRNEVFPSSVQRQVSADLFERLANLSRA